MGKSVIISEIGAYRYNNLGTIHFLAGTDPTLNITALEDITISFTRNLEYNNGTSILWKTLEANTEYELESGKTLIVKGNILPTESDGVGTFDIFGECTISGDILALINNGTMGSYTFKKLFENCTGITDASELILPNYTSQNCYEAMFKGCTSLEKSPILLAETLVTNCYKEMFYGCSSLNTITIGSMTQLGTSYTNNWVYGVSETGILIPQHDITYTEFGVHGIPSGWDIEEFVIPFNEQYFTIESLENSNTISIIKGPITPNISYSKDDGETWTALTISSNTTNISTINTGDKLLIKGINSRLATAWNNYDHFNGTKTFKVYGNVMSLLFGDNFISNSEFTSNTTHNLCGLFQNSKTIIDASNLILPALTCMESSYNGMFRGCTNLTTAPKLPATQSASDCYSSMFESCINLEEAPEINLVNMSQASCKNMFCMDRNSKLTTPKMTKSPILRCATTATNCYEGMFRGNGNLIEITCLKTDNVGACSNWIVNVSSMGTFKKSPLKTNWPNDNSGIPSGWPVVDYVEE